MKAYRVTGPRARFFTGSLRLSEKQYESRRHCLKPLGEGIFEISTPVEFKQNEVVEYDGEVNKAFLQDITPVPETIVDAVKEVVGKVIPEALKKKKK